MSALAHRLRNLLQRRSIGRYGHIQEVQGVPLYEARPPWWARFTWGFIAADLLVTSTMTELTWTKWTLPPDNKPAGDDRDARPIAGGRPRLRPAWQRAGLCFGHLAVGVSLAAALLIARSRVVRILHVLAPSAGAPKRLLIAGAHGYGRRGAVVPFSRARIEPGRDETEVILRIQDVRGHWWIGLTRARLRGVPVPPAHMRDALLAEWGIRKPPPLGQGDHHPSSGSAGRWKTGPVLENW
ncbi:hypothetical protein F5148DRAFT_975118 [Russula earlei]|uniref:Uncharacterized protein n=1 Tax=Russula earlei TaxID=71964 RepID=A0ACC0UIL4_9AGAM|nr:hypothetical protein F5148DRAFT_975118 [Russula earlei]